MPPLQTLRDKNPVKAKKWSLNSLSFDNGDDDYRIPTEVQKGSSNAPESESEEDSDSDVNDIMDQGPGLSEDFSDNDSDDGEEPTPMTDEEFSVAAKSFYKALGKNATRFAIKSVLRFCHEAIRRDHKFYTHMCKVKISSAIVPSKELKWYNKPPFKLEVDYLSEIGVFGNMTGKISYWYYHLPGSSKVILWSDGQKSLAGHPQTRRLLSTMAHTFNASILHYDYPGHGRSTTPGFPHLPRSLPRDLELSLEKMINVLSERFGWSRRQMILGCRCLGCFPTSWIASMQEHGTFGAIIMITPMVDGEDAFRMFFRTEEMVTIPDELNLKLSHINRTIPLQILAADNDEYSSLQKVQWYFAGGGHGNQAKSTFVTLKDATHNRYDEAFAIGSMKDFILDLEKKGRFRPMEKALLVSRRFCSEMLGFWDDLAKNPTKYDLSHFTESFVGKDFFSKVLLFNVKWSTWPLTTPIAKVTQKLLDTKSENLKSFNRNGYCDAFIKKAVKLPSREEAGKPFQRPIYEESKEKKKAFSVCSFGTNPTVKGGKWCF